MSQQKQKKKTKNFENQLKFDIFLSLANYSYVSEVYVVVSWTLPRKAAFFGTKNLQGLLLILSKEGHRPR